MDYNEILDKLFQKSNFREGIELIKKLELDSSVSQTIQTRIQVKKIKFLEKLEKYSEALILAENLLNLPTTASNPKLRAQILIERAKVLFSTGDMTNCLITIKMAELNLISYRNDRDPESNELMAMLILLRGGYNWHHGELKNALYYFKLNLELQEEIQNPLDLAHAYNNVGVLYNATGDLTSALKYLKTAYQKYDQIGSTRGLSKTGNNIGAILIQLGKLDEALYYMKKSLDTDIIESYIDGIRVASHNIGEVYWHKGEFQMALAYLKQSLDLCSKIKDNFHITETLIPLIAVSLELNYITKAEAYLTQIKEIEKQSENAIIHQRFLLANSLILIQKNDKVHLEQAETYLKEIVQDKIRYHDISMMAVIHLCRIQIKQMERTNDLSIMNDLNENLEFIINNCLESHSHSLLIQSYLIKARLSMINLNFADSQKLFLEAKNKAHTYGLNRLEHEICLEYDRFLLNSAFWKWNSHVEIEHYKKSQINQIKLQLESFFAPKNTQINDLNKEDPYALIFLNKKGNILLTKEFNPEWKENSLAFDIFKLNLNTKLQQFLFDSIDLAKYEEFNLIFREFKEVIICYVFKGSSFIASRKMDSLITKLNEKQIFISKLSKASSENKQIYMAREQFFSQWLQRFITTST
ncbi:hypothetical protein NEF87_001244 [Candidatus Lokiarchaeum ossiferum]|uniref:MalT-like TPR region domain-containing protein n=1 Tax=Candidatus Lokiarchaeum ossiferum TaxID=2951803 RepID=A0ABY6HQV6_9ARCH|nr:hypothetical protein NEF87_001244 [Candidatus Lokiarchaeum sp. B-35]